MIVSINAAGELFVDLGDQPEAPIDEATLVNRVAGINKYKPGTQFLVRGDTGVPYGRVVQVMALMQGAGLSSVGLLTVPPANRP